LSPPRFASNHDAPWAKFVKNFTKHLRLEKSSDKVPLRLSQISFHTKMNAYCCCCLTAAALIGAIQTASAADIVGKITLKGTPPPEKPIVFPDASCGNLHKGPVTTKFYVVGPGGELGDVFVYIKEGAKPTPPPAEPVVLDQVGCLYTPYIFGIHTGQKLIIRNSDPNILHNVHILPAPGLNKESNQAQMKGQDLTKTFDKPEVLLHFQCDVHQWMHAYAGVVDHPYYSVSAKDGSFKLANVPPGKYVVEAYHRKAGKQTKEITVSDKNETIDFTFEVPNK
jgi:hypothetical protein